MKPSGKRHQNCQTNYTKKPKIYTNEQLFVPKIINRSKRSCFVSPVVSLVEMRQNQDMEDLKRVYNVLSAIEGRVRRLKTNLRM